MSGKIGILLANVGTPDAPTYWAVRRFLREFLSDRRVIKLSRWIWLPILYLFVLSFRPLRSARAYRKIWTSAGSPLLLHGHAQQRGVCEALREQLGGDIEVRLGMAYGTPSLSSAIDDLQQSGCTRMLCLPLYPQWSGTTSGSVSDQALAQVQRMASPPQLRVMRSYESYPPYLDALVSSVREAFEVQRPDALLLSFHSIPKSYVDENEPYQLHCEETAALLTEAIDLPNDRIHLAYQSRFGPMEWLGPSTVDTLARLANEGVEKVDVLCPGFSSDCLETLEEIGIAAKEHFEAHGGRQLRLIPCLNSRPDHIAALSSLIESEIRSWRDSQPL